MGTELNKKTFQDVIRQDLEWLAKQKPSLESAHIDTCLRWLRDDGYELLVDIQRLPSKPNADCLAAWARGDTANEKVRV